MIVIDLDGRDSDDPHRCDDLLGLVFDRYSMGFGYRVLNVRLLLCSFSAIIRTEFAQPYKW